MGLRPGARLSIRSARTGVADEVGNEQQDELPAVLSATDARALVEDSLARRWAERDKLTLRLPPSFIGLEPGTVLELDLAPSLWEVRRCTIESNGRASGAVAGLADRARNRR